ncbi:MAG TPA: hypothetical protein VFF06_37035 [Polyangia bacterium]|nr:hypothetical protein [Polyangia bacterium]
MRTISISALLAAAAIAVGCNDSTVAVTNDNPTGTVGGLILTANDQMPLAGVNIKIITGGLTLTATTQTDGTFLIPKVPVGNFVFNASLMGYTSAQFQSSLFNGSALPVKNPVQTIGPIGLIKADATFNVRLVDETGGPVPMVKVTGRTQRASYVDFTGGNPFGVGQQNFEVTSGPDGLVQFSGLPEYATVVGIVDTTFIVDVPPTKINGAEAYSFLGVSQSFDLSNLSFSGGNPEAPTILLAGPHTQLSVIASNLAYVSNNLTQTLQVPPNGPLFVEFNQAINPNTVRVVFYNEDGVTQAQAQPMATVTTNLLQLTPNQALVAGARYNVLIHVDSALNAPNSGQQLNEYNSVAPFFVQQASGVTPTVNTTSVTKTVSGGGIVTVTFTLNEAIGLGGQNSNPIDCVAFYEGVNLDNGDPANYVGEWSSNGAMQCFSQGNPPPGQNITVLRPIEAAPGGLVTGFASKFAIDINNSPAAGTNPAACKPGDPVGSCAGPQSGNKIHLVFSKLPVSATVRRTNGQPVTDDPTKLVITIP